MLLLGGLCLTFTVDIMNICDKMETSTWSDCVLPLYSLKFPLSYIFFFIIIPFCC